MPGNPLNIGNLVGGRKPLILPADARERHLYVSGGTGVGKSKFLEQCIRQDIYNHKDSGCGLILFDPHGLLYDNIMMWLAKNNLDRPVIPIEPRRDDWVISYNVLRKREEADPAVVVGRFVRALAHVWGQGGTDQTPLFARWASILLRTLYENGFTVPDLVHLLARDDLRQAMVLQVDDHNARQAWEFARNNRKEFEQQITSTLNRFTRMYGPKVMQATFGQPGKSLDLLESLEEGHIILVNLSTKGGMIDKEDANTYATLLLTDLWSAAEARGKEERENVRPFYVYMDECQRFITPTIAENLDEGRGFGLHLILANQYPKQFINAGEHGQAMYDSIMANVPNKIVFKQEHPEDAKGLAEWLFMPVLDTDEVKHEIWSTKVIGTKTEMRESVTAGSSHTLGSASGKGGGSFHGQSNGDGTGEAETTVSSDTGDDDSISRAAAWNKSFTDSSGESESWSEAKSESASKTKSTTRAAVDVSVFGQELSSRQYRPVEEQIFRATQKLFDQKDRHYAIRFHGGPKAPLFVTTPTVEPTPWPVDWVDDYRVQLLRQLPFALPMVDALKLREDREQKLLTDLVYAAESDEIESIGRRIKRV